MDLLDPRIKLRHIQCFLETARRGSVVRAAEALGMTQPAASKTLKELEDALGQQLFDRSRRTLTLSRPGEIFLGHASLAVASLRQGLAALDSARSGAAVVNVGGLPTVINGLLPAALLRFADSPSYCRVRVESGPSPYVMGLLRSGELDFVLGRMATPAGMSGLSFEHLYAERIVLAVRPAHPLVRQRPLDLRAIEAFPVLMPPPGAIIRPAVDRLLLAAGAGRLHDEIETISNSLGRALTRNSDTVWIISEGAVAADLAEGHLVTLDVDTGPTLGPIGITTRTGTRVAAPAEALIAEIRAVAARN